MIGQSQALARKRGYDDAGVLYGPWCTSPDTSTTAVARYIFRQSYDEDINVRVMNGTARV